MLRIVEPGLETTVQDLGRYGHYHYGVPPSGAADKYSFIAGNLLLGNPPEFAGLEFTLLGPKIEFKRDSVICITGAQTEPYVNHRRVSMWENTKVNAGDILHFSPVSEGVKTYICISGGIQVPEVLGSRSTYLYSQFGGYKGRKLKCGDCLPVGEALPGVFKQVGKALPTSFLPVFSRFHEIRVMMGLSGTLISDDGVKSFLNSDWKVSTESNRVAYRFNGGSIGFRHSKPFSQEADDANVVDMIYPIGVIMVPNEEEVIVLLNDGTTGGGFITIGTVISPDLDLIARARPLTAARFIGVTMDQAVEISRKKQKKLAYLADALK